MKVDLKKAIHHEGHEDNEGKRIEYFMNCVNITDKLNAVIQRFQIQSMVSTNRVEMAGLRPSSLPHHRTCGFPHPAVEPGDLMV
ncbi:MAG: hypothetical protein CVV06_20810, partial [Gammaproteobacteria bacterium HGW-Gammaproteobacteria-10]